MVNLYAYSNVYEKITEYGRHQTRTTSGIPKDPDKLGYDSLGVHWNEDNIARDLMQNFYDANRGNLSEVKVKVQGSDVAI